MAASDCHRTDRAPGIPQNEPDIRPGHPRCARVGYPPVSGHESLYIKKTSGQRPRLTSEQHRTAILVCSPSVAHGNGRVANSYERN